MPWFQFNLRDFAVCFLSILFEGVPFLFLGTLVSGLVEVFLPAESLGRWLPRRPLLAICLSALMGNLFPMCECGVVPVIRRMLAKGLPVSCGVTYLLAAPIVNPIAAMSTYAAFRGRHPGLMTCWRLVLGGSIAVAAGYIIEHLPVGQVLNEASLVVLPGRRRTAAFRVPEAPYRTAEFASTTIAPASLGQRLSAALRCAAFDFLDVCFYLILGTLVASMFNTAIDKQILLPLAAHVWLSTAVLMSLALLLSLCSTSDAFIATTFAGFPPAAKLAFMVLGPMMDFKLLFMYGLVFRKRLTATLTLGLMAVIGLTCVVFRRFIL